MSVGSKVTRVRGVLVGVSVGVDCDNHRICEAPTAAAATATAAATADLCQRRITARSADAAATSTAGCPYL